MAAADSPTPTTMAPAPTLVTDGQVLHLAQALPYVGGGLILLVDLNQSSVGGFCIECLSTGRVSLTAGHHHSGLYGKAADLRVWRGSSLHCCARICTK